MSGVTDAPTVRCRLWLLAGDGVVWCLPTVYEVRQLEEDANHRPVPAHGRRQRRLRHQGRVQRGHHAHT